MELIRKLIAEIKSTPSNIVNGTLSAFITPSNSGNFNMSATLRPSPHTPPRSPCKLNRSSY